MRKRSSGTAIKHISGFCFLILLALLSATLRAETTARPESLSNQPVIEIEMGISFAIPPWVIQESDSGIELDILRQALEPSGYRIIPRYLSNALAYSLFNSQKLDGVINARRSVIQNGGFLTEPVVAFQNVAISLVDKGFPDEIDMDFLQDKSIVAFQRASQLLGPEFGRMARANPHYQELAQQRLQINLLMIREVDFIVLDKSIFGYYWHQARKDQALTQARSRLDRPVKFHYLFAPSEYVFAFQEQKVRDDFNAGLARLKDNGGYDRIIKNYDHLKSLYTEKP